MTSGSPTKLLISFALPMFIGDLFIQLYNVVDSIVVGRFIGTDALAAVGSAFAMMLFLNSIITGLGVGSGVIYAQLFGAKDYPTLKRAIIISAIFILCVSGLLSLLSIIFCNQIVILYQMPPQTASLAASYLRCIFAGMFPLGGFIICANLLRAMGDSKTPLYFLALSCFLNVGFDLWFVVGFDMGVFGAALATLIAQIISCGLGIFFVVKKLSFLNFTREDFVFDRLLFKKICSCSLLTSFQQAIMNFGILLVQGLINTYGTVLMAAFSIGVKIDAFAYMPVQDLGFSLSTFTAQNVGAKNYRQVNNGVRSAVIMTAGFSIFVSIFVVLFAPWLVGIFVKADDVEVIALGAQYLRIEGIFYILVGFLFLFYGFFRGIGKPAISIVLTVISLGLRVLIAYTFSGGLLGYTAIFWAIPIGWLIADVAGLIFYRRHINYLGKIALTN